MYKAQVLVMWGQCCSWDIQSWLWNIFLLYLFELATKNVAIGWAETLKCNQSWFSKYFKSSTLYITGMLLPRLCWCIAAFIDVLLLCLSIRWQRDTVWRDVYHVILVCVREWYEIKGNQLIKKKYCSIEFGAVYIAACPYRAAPIHEIMFC